MNYKEYFKEQLFEALMEDTFAEREASQGRAAARSKAEYFTGLMAAVGRRRAGAGVPMGPKNEGQKVEDLTGQREAQMYKKHTGTSPKDLLDGKRHDDSARTITHQLGQGTAPRSLGLVGSPFLDSTDQDLAAGDVDYYGNEIRSIRAARRPRARG